MKELLSILGAIIIIIFTVFIARPNESSGCKSNRFNENDNLLGIVTKKVWNSKSHSNEQIILDSKQVFEWEEKHYAPFSIFDKFEVGDLVEKKKGSLEIMVIRRNDTTIVDISFPCDENLECSKKCACHGDSEAQSFDFQ